jgi:hypothetical protein
LPRIAVSPFSRERSRPLLGVGLLQVALRFSLDRLAHLLGLLRQRVREPAASIEEEIIHAARLRTRPKEPHLLDSSSAVRRKEAG